ncbi:transmembrane protein 106C isoform X1 [Grus americana]|uniref:transmembrane protein 106C isoform X1 n=1 Tax=Grus americana TaxID=9117 RepID=UPI002407ED07|nr:transmembrane protein 106C isoform X1 [Grus americana]XP_054662969.1 transmembrane protein 106C isoform X1 [Grus americana]XP_054662970.1 transmembrane protein 106C isoform X1 [Grus americana]
MGSVLSLSVNNAASRQRRKAEDDDDDLLDSRDRVEDIAKFPYVEFTGQDSITCPTCQGTGCIPTEQVNELVALIPYSDQRLRPQRTKLYVLLSVLLCLLISGLVVFFLFPHSVLVDDDGIKVVQVWFDKKNSVVILAITVKLAFCASTFLVGINSVLSCQGCHGLSRLPPLFIQATLRIRNSNFYSVTVTSLTSQVQYMNTVVGTQQNTNVSSIQPLSDKLVNFTVKAELGGPFSYVYFFCTFPKVKVHNIVIFMRTSVKLSYIGHVTQSALETYHYVDCSTNSTAPQDLLLSLSTRDEAKAKSKP